MRALAGWLAFAVLAFAGWFVLSHLAPRAPFDVGRSRPPALQARPVPTTCPARAAYQLPDGAWACTPGPYGTGNQGGQPPVGSEPGPG